MQRCVRVLLSHVHLDEDCVAQEGRCKVQGPIKGRAVSGTFEETSNVTISVKPEVQTNV
jgi:quinolinate synthase